MLQADHQEIGDGDGGIQEDDGAARDEAGGEEGRLYRLLKEGPAREIMPSMVHRVIEGLAEEGNADVEKLKSEAKELGNRVK